MNINALIEKDFSELSREDWDELRAYLKGDRTGNSPDSSDLETRLAESVQDWEKFSRVISDILNS